MKKRDLKLTPKELKKKQQYRAKGYMFKPFVIILVMAIVVIGFSYYFYISNKSYWSDLSMSIGGGIIAGMIVYILGNIKQKNIIQAKKQAIEIKIIMETFIMVKSLVVKILKKDDTLLLFSKKCYYIPKNISDDDAIKILKNCLKKIEDIDVNRLTILKKFNEDLYKGLENYSKSGLYNDFNNIKDEEFIKKLQDKSKLLFDIIFEIEFNSDAIEEYFENIELQIF